MCGDSHLPAAPESRDLIAIIHPATLQPEPIPRSFPLSRTNSNASSVSTSSTSSTSTSPSSISGRLRLSNCQPGSTISEFSSLDSSSIDCYEGLNIRIHRYGFPLHFGEINPVLHEFGMGSAASLKGLKLDLGVGGEGVIGRTVSIVDVHDRVLGEGIIGRI